MTMQKQILWTPHNGAGCEHLMLDVMPEQVSAEGLIIGVDDNLNVFWLRYDVTCNALWRVRSVWLCTIQPGEQMVQLTTDGEGHWCDHAQKPLPALVGCVDIDISATPFTNTLPIRRLALQPGESATTRVVYFAVPALTFAPQRQRYTRLDETRYRYEGLDTGYTNEITVDADGLVGVYPGLFRRVM